MKKPRRRSKPVYHTTRWFNRRQVEGAWGLLEGWATPPKDSIAQGDEWFRAEVTIREIEP